MMGKFGTLLLWVITLLVLILLSWGLTLYMEWPLWAVLVTVLGVLGLYALIRAIVRLVQVHRSRARMNQLSASPSDTANGQLSTRAQLLLTWKQAIATLRNSSLRRLGNPLYVLPWYMVVGKSGTGKTTALTRSRLASSIQKVNQSAPIVETANFDWWFFDRAVVIDCAGRYVDATDLEQDRGEWELGLNLLAKYRIKEGLNGLVLAISAERLLNPDRDALIAEGHIIRGRIEQTIQKFGKRFPVYVLVTQCDRVYGLEQWAKQLPESALEQAIGFLCEPGSEPGDNSFVDHAFESIGERLHALRVRLIARATQITPELLLFPNELQRLKPGVDVFLKACLGGSAYLETPFLRGLFFSSGLQEGGAISTLLSSVLPPVPRHGANIAGLFLHDFFGRVLPQDRYLALPTSVRHPFQSMTRNLGLLTWMLFCTAIAGMMTVSFVYNVETLRLLQKSNPFNVKFVGRIEPDVATLRSVFTTVAQQDERNSSWHSGWMVTTTNMRELENRLKHSYIENFRKYILPIDDANYAEDIERVMSSDPGNEYPRQMRNIVRYINQLSAREHGGNLKDLAALPQREYVGRYTPETFSSLSGLYLANMAWAPLEENYVSHRLLSQRQLLNKLVFNDPQLRWLTGLVLSNPDIPAVTVFDFWSTANRGAAKPKDGELPVVDSAFTKEGKKHIDSFLLELERSIDNGPKFLKGRQAFEDWYKEQRVLAWKTFLAKFPGTENLLSGEVAWRTSLGKIAGPQDPYYKLMDRLNSEFGEEHVDKLPGWLQLSRQLGQVRAQAMGVGVGGEAAKVVGAINTAGGKAIKEFFDGKPAQSKVTFTGDLSAVSAMQQFLTGINSASVEVSTGTGKAMQVAIDFHNFGRDPSIKSSELLNLAENLKSLRKFIGFTGPDEEAVWQLMGAPLQFLLQYTEQQASCALQKEWEAKVDFPLQTVASMDSLVEQLYGAKGSVWAFADGAAKPFLTQNANRFGVVQTLGYSVPFTRDFLPMLNDAAGRRVEQLVMKQRAEMEDQSQKLETEKEQLQIQQSLAQIERVLVDIKQKVESLKAQVLQFSIAAQPTSVNPEAKAKPFQTVLTIQCANGARIINNFNFQVTDTVTIGDRSCGDVSLQIRIDDVVLTKNYAGSKGVVHFLQDFVDGSRHFVVDDFPSSRNRLVALGVNRIGVRYNFEGQDAVVRLSQQLDALDQQEKDKLAEKARLQDQQLRLEQVGMQTKMSSGRRTAKVSVVLPEEIGVCWNTRLSANTAQDSQAMFSEAAAEQLAAPASPTKTSAKAKTKGN